MLVAAGCCCGQIRRGHSPTRPQMAGPLHRLSTPRRRRLGTLATAFLATLSAFPIIRPAFSGRVRSETDVADMPAVSTLVLATTSTRAFVSGTRAVTCVETIANFVVVSRPALLLRYLLLYLWCPSTGSARWGKRHW